MRISGLFLLICILFSCSEETPKAVSSRNELKKYIEERYQTKEVSATFGPEIKNGKEESCFRVSVGKSPVIDQSKSEPELFTSDIVFRLYCDMDKSERKKYDVFSVKITQNNQVTEISYTNKQLKEVNTNLLWLDGFFQLLAKKEYHFAKGQFNSGLVDTAAIDLEGTYESIAQNLGKLKKQELQGFEIGETSIDSHTYPVMKAHYISFYENQYTLCTYTLLMDASNQKLIDLEIK